MSCMNGGFDEWAQPGWRDRRGGGGNDSGRILVLAPILHSSVVSGSRSGTDEEWLRWHSSRTPGVRLSELWMAMRPDGAGDTPALKPEAKLRLTEPQPLSSAAD